MAKPLRRGMIINGDFVRTLRKLRGWSQSDLAVRAGVSERTVRNAERSMVVELNVAEWLAGALEKPLAEIATDRTDSDQQKNWGLFMKQFDCAYSEAILNLNLSPLLELTHPDIQLYCVISPRLPFCGQFNGPNGIAEHCHAVNEWLLSCRFGSRKTTFETVRGEGELIYVRGAAQFASKRQRISRFWIAKVLQLKDEKIFSIDQYLGPSAP